MRRKITVFGSLLVLAMTFSTVVFAADSSVGEDAYLKILQGDEECVLYAEGTVQEDVDEYCYYDEASNTLYLENFKDDLASIEASEMGPGFTVQVSGENRIRSIYHYAGVVGGSITMTGEGSLTINEDKASEDTPIYVDANYTDSFFSVEDSVKLQVYGENETIVVEYSSNASALRMAVDESRIDTTSVEISSDIEVEARDVQSNTFFGIKDEEDRYVTAVYDNDRGDLYYYEFQMYSRQMGDASVVFAQQTEDEDGCPVEIESDQIDYTKEIIACQILTPMNTRYLCENTEDDSDQLYAVSEMSTDGEETWQWYIYQVIEDEQLGKIFYPYATELDELPENYTVLREKKLGTSFTIWGDVANFSLCGHSFTEYKSNNDATCTEDGTKSAVCDHGCGAVDTITDPGSAKGHVLKTTVTKATQKTDGKIVATCTNAGCTYKTTTVIKKVSSVSLGAASYVYDGKAKSPSVTIKDAAGKKLVKNTDYSITYASGRKTVGSYSVKITFQGNYSGTKALNFTIVPKGTTIASLKALSGGITVGIKKQATQTTGYEIQYSTSSKFTSPKSVTISKNTTLTRKITKLTKGKKYYVRVRTYKTVSSKKYYSSWSAAKYVTTKK